MQPDGSAPMARPAATLLLQMLAWIAERPRDYAATMDAWRTSCPRLSVWEDAVADSLVCVDGGGSGGQSIAAVQLTSAGTALLAASIGPLAGARARPGDPDPGASSTIGPLAGAHRRSDDPGAGASRPGAVTITTAGVERAATRG
jgi:hypothetical protein